MTHDEFQRPYIRICPDYVAALGFDSEEDDVWFGCDNDEIEIYGYEKPFVVPGIYDWCSEWEIDNYNYIHNLPQRPEELTWWYRGYGLLLYLRKIMPKEVHLYYGSGSNYIEIPYIVEFNREVRRLLIEKCAST